MGLEAEAPPRCRSADGHGTKRWSSLGSRRSENGRLARATPGSHGGRTMRAAAMPGLLVRRSRLEPRRGNACIVPSPTGRQRRLGGAGQNLPAKQFRRREGKPMRCVRNWRIDAAGTGAAARQSASRKRPTNAMSTGCRG